MIIEIIQLNVKIEISENTTEECFDYLISNIEKVKDNFKDFHISYAFYASSDKEAIKDSLFDLAEKYEEYLDNNTIN